MLDVEKPKELYHNNNDKKQNKRRPTQAAFHQFHQQ